MHIDVPDTLPQYPEVREFVNIKSLLSEADRKLLAETECDEAESLLEWIENEAIAMSGRGAGRRTRRAADGCACCRWMFKGVYNKKNVKTWNEKKECIRCL